MVRSACCVAASVAVLAGTVAVGGCSQQSRPNAVTRSVSRPTSPTSTTRVGVGPSADATRDTAYIARVQWVPDARGRSLHVFPTAAARTVRDPTARSAAWQQVVRRASAADTTTMHMQFDCHWDFARIADPSKPSWNLETWRPVVDAQTMFDTRCNPGGPEE